MDSKILKNLLDLEYNKYLQIYHTSIVLLFSFLIGVLIALLTNQIDFSNMAQVGIFFTVTIMIIFSIIGFMVTSHYRLKKIPKEIMKLEL